MSGCSVVYIGSDLVLRFLDHKRSKNVSGFEYRMRQCLPIRFYEIHKNTKDGLHHLTYFYCMDFGTRGSIHY